MTKLFQWWDDVRSGQKGEFLWWLSIVFLVAFLVSFEVVTALLIVYTLKGGSL